MTMSPILLNYRSRPKRRRKPNTRFAYGVLVLAVIISGILWLMRPRLPVAQQTPVAVVGINNKSEFLELEEHCRSYEPDSVPVYFNAQSNSADVYLRNDSRFIRFSDCELALSPGYQLSGDHVWTIGDQVYRPVQQWEQFVRAIDGPQQRHDFALLFLHERSAKGGGPRLVAVELKVVTSTVQLWTTVLDPSRQNRAEGFRAPAIISQYDTPIHDLLPKRFGFFEGQADVADTSHFTIRTTSDVGNSTAILHGWLLINDAVQFKLE